MLFRSNNVPPKDGGDRHCCSQCGIQYQAFKTGKALVPAHHVWVFGGHCAPETIGTGTGRMAEQHCTMVLGQWPETAEEVWIQQMQEHYANIPQEFQDLTVEQATARMISLVRKHSVPSVFRPVSISPYALQAIMNRNSKITQGRPRFHVDHIPLVFMGAVAPWAPGAPVLTPLEIGHMIALSSVIQRQRLSHL